MPPNIVSIFFIPTGFYSITPKGMHALAETLPKKKHARKQL